MTTKTCPDETAHQIARASIRDLAALIVAASDVDEHVYPFLGNHCDLTTAELGYMDTLVKCVRQITRGGDVR